MLADIDGLVGGFRNEAKTEDEEFEDCRDPLGGTGVATIEFPMLCGGAFPMAEARRLTSEEPPATLPFPLDSCCCTPPCSPPATDRSGVSSLAPSFTTDPDFLSVLLLLLGGPLLFFFVDAVPTSSSPDESPPPSDELTFGLDSDLTERSSLDDAADEDAERGMVGKGGGERSPPLPKWLWLRRSSS